MPPMIALSEIRFTYNGQKHAVFENLSLDIPAGSVTAILGPNGAGKSTLLHLILGILSPASGRILLRQRSRQQYTRRELGRLIGLVAQDEAMPFNFTVLEYVLLGRAPYLPILQTPGPEDGQVAQRALTTVGMEAMAERSVQTLSGGERQLVTIARALAQQPRILLLDEPTSHLDLSNKGRVLQLMCQSADDGVTVVFTTHEPDLSAVADYLILMRQGQTLAAGPADAVFTSDNLSQTYGVPVAVAQVDGQRVVLTPTGPA
ncbi:MAG TPA: ABC transporter ATP-binding protein [Chloroflexi bacterium]|nr:ABC transporter ATP-binding protein [Chloroflexota bacterium]